jgi:AraC-like DNA-binding protein
MPKLSFSSDELPAGMTDRARFQSWRDTFVSHLGGSDFIAHHDRPFLGKFEFMVAGTTMLMRQRSTVEYWARTSHHVASEARGDFLLGFSRGSTPQRIMQRNREVTLKHGEFTLFTNAEAAEARTAGEMSLVGVGVPRARLIERIGHVEDLAITRLDGTTPAARHLRGYLEFLLNADAPVDDPLLIAHVETTLLDLVALALGANRDAADVARMRGLRAVRLHEIVRAIKANYADPAFGVRRVAQKLGVSPRYVNDLLHDTGSSLAERVLELRLQKARAMLGDPANDRLKIVEIAYGCGFNEVSYFNRCFRRRFGGSPTQFRGPPNGRG